MAITSFGANTSLGASAGACAAMRAGLVRPAPLTSMMFDTEEGDVPVTGHPVPTARGFVGEARLLSLCLPALRDLASAAGLASTPHLALSMSLPDLGERAAAARAPRPPELRLLDRVVEASGLTIPADVRLAFLAGPAGFGLAVQAALGLIGQGRAEACVVGGVDSLCDDLAVGALAVDDHLKSGDNPVGMQPGEAAAFLLLEAPGPARRRKATPLAHVEVAVAQDPRSREEAPLGQGLYEAIRQAADGSLPAGGGWFLLDLNGETRRASDWGHCQQRLARRLPSLLPAIEWTPATSFGDTGAASGALAAILAVRAIQRGYGPRPMALILGSSAGGRRAATRIEGGT